MNEICVCAEPSHERGLYPCAHALCLSCTSKKRVLMKDLNCPYCRSAADEVAVVENGEAGFGDAQTEFRRGRLRVQNDDLKVKLNHILQYPCPECDEECHDLRKSKKHLQTEHNKAVCDVCAKNEFNFSDEFITYAPDKIKDHSKKRHIFCKYCRSYFYGTAEFAQHCKKVHVACDICERRDPEHPQYFEHYTQLRNHYQDKHYRCMEPECLANMHIVFGTAVESQKHMMEAHHMSAQAVNVDFDQPHATPVDTPSHDSRSSGRGNGRNNNRNNHNNRGNDNNNNNRADGARSGPDRDETAENEEAKYSARSEIVASHDQDKVSKIRGANATFLARKVPVDIFIATCEAVLKRDASFDSQITLLLKAFAKAHGSQMTPENLRSSNFKLYQREQAEIKQAEAEQEERRLKTGTYAQQSGGSSGRSKGPAPMQIQPINWGSKSPRSGGLGSLAELPRLGSSRSTTPNSISVNTDSSTSSSGRSTAARASPSPYANINRPSVSLHDLPKSQKKSKPKPVAPPPPLSPAASLAQLHMGSSPSTSSSHVNDRLNNRPSRSSSPFTVPHPVAHSRGSSASSSSSSLSSRGSQLGDLPSSPKNAKKEKKKRQHNVVRIV